MNHTTPMGVDISESSKDAQLIFVGIEGDNTADYRALSTDAHTVPTSPTHRLLSPISDKDQTFWPNTNAPGLDDFMEIADMLLKDVEDDSGGNDTLFGQLERCNPRPDPEVEQAKDKPLGLFSFDFTSSMGKSPDIAPSPQQGSSTLRMQTITARVLLPQPNFETPAPTESTLRQPPTELNIVTPDQTPGKSFSDVGMFSFHPQASLSPQTFQEDPSSGPFAIIPLTPESGERERCITPTKQHDQHCALWQRRFSELEQYKQQHGHCNVPQKYVKNRSLGAWVARQRLIMREWEEQHPATGHGSIASRKSTLASDRVERLRNLGLEASIGKGAFGKLCNRNTKEWEKQFEELVKYRKVHGHADVPTKKTSLGKWVARQRKHHREYLADEGSSGKEDQLRWRKVLESRFQRLGEVGFSFHIGKGGSQPRKRVSK